MRFPLNEDGYCRFHGRCYPEDRKDFIGFHRIFLENRCVKKYDPEEVRKINQDMGEIFFTFRQDVHAPANRWLENTADFQHLKSVHEKFGNLFSGKPYDIQISDDKRNSSHKIMVNPKIVASYEGQLGLSLPSYFFHVLLFPYTSLTSFMDCFYSYERAYPKGPDACEVWTNFWTSKTHKLPGFYLELAKEANTRILEEDKAILEAWAPTARNTGNWFAGEQRVRAYRQAWGEK